jgi:hypothetical protein
VVLEEHVAVVDEQDRGGVLLGALEEVLDALEEVAGAGDEGAVEQEELALEAVGQRPADGGLAGAGRPGQEDAALGLQTQLASDLVVLQRHDDVGLQAADDVVHAAQVVQADRLDLLQVHVAEEAVGAEVGDEAVGVEVVLAVVPLAGGLELVGVQLAGEAVDLAEVEALGAVLAEEVAAQEGIIVGVELADAGEVAALLDRPGRVAGDGEDELLAGIDGAGGQGGERRVEQPEARVEVMAADGAEQPQVVHEDGVVFAEGVENELLEGLFEGGGVALAQGLGEVLHVEEGAAEVAVELAQDGGPPQAGAGGQDEDVAQGQQAPQLVVAPLLGRAQLHGHEGPSRQLSTFSPLRVRAVSSARKGGAEHERVVRSR